MSSVRGASGRPSASRRSARAACISSVQRWRASSLSSPSEPSTSETPNSRCTTRSWISRARSMRAASSRARPCWVVAMRALAASAAVLPSVHIAWRSDSSSLKWPPPRSAKITPSQRPPADTGRAGERLDAGEARVALRHPASELAGHLDHAVLGERHLRDRRLLERAVDLGQQAGLDAVAAHRDDQLADVVVEHQARALHRGEAAERLAERIVEITARGARTAVELGQQPDDHIQRIRARRGWYLPASLSYSYPGGRYAACKESLRAWSGVSETVACVSTGAAAADHLGVEVVDQQRPVDLSPDRQARQASAAATRLKSSFPRKLASSSVSSIV